MENTIQPIELTELKKTGPIRFNVSHETVFGCPPDFLDNRFVYVVVSARARGLSIGVNMNPDKLCNFDCVYCEVNHTTPPREKSLDVDGMAAELKKTVEFVRKDRLRERSSYRALPDDLLQLRHVALSGDGEPTLSPKFAEALQAAVHVRALTNSSFFKIVLITNATGLDQPHVQQGLKHLTKLDEIWAKLDGGTQRTSTVSTGPRCRSIKSCRTSSSLAGSGPSSFKACSPQSTAKSRH